MLAPRDAQRVLDRLDTLAPAEAQALLTAFVHDISERAAHDGLFWLKWVQTRDEADPQHTIKSFPVHLEYIQQLWTLLCDSQRVVVAKSRQMLLSWVLCAFCCWWARYKAHQAVYWQTQQWKDAVGMTCSPAGAPMGRCQFIEANLPRWMQLETKLAEGMLAYPNGSVIQAVAGGADQIRGKVGSVIVLDEFAHQDEQAGVYTTVAPLVQKGAKLFIVSTPNGTGNVFSTLWHGRPVGREG